MKVYTSYFANKKNLDKEGILAVSIARYTPRWFYGPRYTHPAPTSYMLSPVCSHEEYLKLYDSILKSMKPEDVTKALKNLGKGRDIALCCYEKPDDFCHRHLFAEWITKNTEFKVEEFVPREERNKIENLSLF